MRLNSEISPWYRSLPPHRLYPESEIDRVDMHPPPTISAATATQHCTEIARD